MKKKPLAKPIVPIEPFPKELGAPSPTNVGILYESARPSTDEMLGQILREMRDMKDCFAKMIYEGWRPRDD